MEGTYGNTSCLLVRCRGEGSEGDPIDESELDVREIVPWVGWLIIPMRVGQKVESLEVSPGEGVFMVVFWMPGLNPPSEGEKHCIFSWIVGYRYGGGIGVGG